MSGVLSYVCGVGVLSNGGGLCGERGAVLLDGGFHRFTALTGAFLNTAQQFILLAIDELKIVVRKMRPFLFEAAFDDVPVAFDFEFGHSADSRALRLKLPWGVTLPHPVASALLWNLAQKGHPIALAAIFRMLWQTSPDLQATARRIKITP